DCIAGIVGSRENRLAVHVGEGETEPSVRPTLGNREGVVHVGAVPVVLPQLIALRFVRHFHTIEENLGHPRLEFLPETPLTGYGTRLGGTPPSFTLSILRLIVPSVDRPLHGHVGVQFDLNPAPFRPVPGGDHDYAVLGP